MRNKLPKKKVKGNFEKKNKRTRVGALKINTIQKTQKNTNHPLCHPFQQLFINLRKHLLIRKDVTLIYLAIQ